MDMDPIITKRHNGEFNTARLNNGDVTETIWFPTDGGRDIIVGRTIHSKDAIAKRHVAEWDRQIKEANEAEQKQESPTPSLTDRAAQLLSYAHLLSIDSGTGIGSMPGELRAIAHEILAEVKRLESFEHETTWETGQPNGAGTVEPSDYREWYRDDRITSRRRVETYYGPWEPWTPEQEREFESTPNH